MNRTKAIILFLLVTAKMLALGFHGVNIDAVTASAMTSAYGAEAAQEAMTTESLRKIVEHYRSASVATAGIVLSRKKDRDAMRNPGLFASEENYYYKRILNLVQNRIMPKLITVASQMVKQPENAIHWGPYLLKTTENVEQLCKQFELVCTNGKLSFKDVKFLLINDDLRKIFDLTQMGANTNWKELLDKLGDIGKGLSKEDIVEDFNNVTSLLAQIGKATVDSNLAEASKIADAFHSSPGEIMKICDDFKEKYEAIKDGGSVKDILMQVIKTADADGVARLFKIDDYNVAGYISNYVKELQGEYYTQRWYIVSEESGSEVLCDYKPTSYDDYKDSRWNAAWHHYESPRDNEQCHTLTATEQQELKEKAASQSGWDQAKVTAYNQQHEGHSCGITYTLVHEDRRESYKHGLGSTHHKRHCFHAYSVKVVDSWTNRKEEYEETFDSQTMELNTFKKRMEARLRGYQAEVEDKEDSHVTYKLCSDPPRYYMMADERKMEGCNSVSFTATCDGGASLGEGSFNWKENGKQGNSLNEKSKEFAMRGTPDSGDNEVDELLGKRKEYEAQISSLQSQIATNDRKQKELLGQIQQAKLAGNQTKATELQSQYDSLSNETASLKNDLNATQQQLNQLNSAIDEYYKDLAEDFDGPYRIPKNMAELEGMYQIQWTDEGNWVEGSDQYIFIRHGYCSSVKSTVTYSATLKLSQKPKYFLGVRIHRAILSVDFKLSSEFSSDNVVAVMKLDMSKSDQQRADEVNEKLQQLMADMPDCSISIKYNYAGNGEADDDEDTIHLLWASDRLDVAREIDYQLTMIYSQLIIIEKVMQGRETILDFLKHKIWDVVGRASRGRIAEYALSRWEDAGLKAYRMQSESTSKKDDGGNQADKNSKNNTNTN